MVSGTPWPQTTEGSLARLVAIHQIQQLAFRYSLAFDSRDLPMLHSLWIEEVERLEYPDINIHTVREDFDRWLYDLGATIQFVSNHVIEFQDDAHAIGTVYALDQIDMGDQYIDQAVLYHDRYAMQEGRWLFERRRHLLWYGQDRGRNPFRQDAAKWPDGALGRGTLPEDFQSYRELRARQPRC
jgi:hypothetical protein